MIDELGNELKYDSDYITKTDIVKNRVNLKKLGFAQARKSEILSAFDDCDYKWRTVGNPYNKSQQKRIKYVSIYELYKRTFKH